MFTLPQPVEAGGNLVEGRFACSPVLPSQATSSRAAGDTGTLFKTFCQAAIKYDMVDALNHVHENGSWRTNLSRGHDSDNPLSILPLPTTTWLAYLGQRYVKELDYVSPSESVSPIPRLPTRAVTRALTNLETIRETTEKGCLIFHVHRFCAARAGLLFFGTGYLGA